MSNQIYTINHNNAPNMDMVKELLNAWSGNDECTFEYFLRGLGSKKNICTLEAFEAENIIGFITAWKSDIHPYCSYCAMVTKPHIGHELEAALMTSVKKFPNIEFPLQTSIWDSSLQLKSFYEQDGFQKMRRTYMPLMRTIKLSILDGFSEKVIPYGSSIKDLTILQSDRNLKLKFINLVKENYRKTHIVNPLGMHDIHEWEKLIFNVDIVEKGSYILINNDEILAYTLLHFSDSQNKLEFGWRGTKEDEDIQLMLMLTAYQINFAAEKGYEYIEAEVDTTDPFAMAMLKFFPFSPTPALITLQLRRNI